MKSTQKCLLFLFFWGTFMLLNAQTSYNHPPKNSSITEHFFQKYPICHLYNISGFIKPFPQLTELIDLDLISPITFFLYKDPLSFSTNLLDQSNGDYNMVLWEGFIPIEKDGTYSFLVTWDKSTIGCHMQLTVDLASKNNWNDNPYQSNDNLLLLEIKLKQGMVPFRFAIYQYDFLPHGKTKSLYELPPPHISLKSEGETYYHTIFPKELFHEVKIRKEQGDLLDKDYNVIPIITGE